LVIPSLTPFAKRVILFGSAARGEERPDSDIDLLIELRDIDEAPPLGLLGLLRLERELGDRLGRRIELATRLKTVVMEEAERDMVVLCEE
jgi:predicted nucleotidyltransferase